MHALEPFGHHFNDGTLYDCGALLTSFDRSREGSLSYQDFLKVILPLNDYENRNKITSAHSVSKPVDHNVAQAFAKLIFKELELLADLNHIRDNLRILPDFDGIKAFQLLGDQFIDYDSLSRFLRKNGFLPNQADLVASVRRLDWDEDGRLSYAEFADGLRYVEPGSNFHRRNDYRSPY